MRMNRNYKKQICLDVSQSGNGKTLPQIARINTDNSKEKYHDYSEGSFAAICVIDVFQTKDFSSNDLWSSVQSVANFLSN
jgi:hypothetical protein